MVPSCVLVRAAQELVLEIEISSWSRRLVSGFRSVWLVGAGPELPSAPIIHSYSFRACKRQAAAPASCRKNKKLDLRSLPENEWSRCSVIASRTQPTSSVAIADWIHISELFSASFLLFSLGLHGLFTYSTMQQNTPSAIFVRRFLGVV